LRLPTPKTIGPTPFESVLYHRRSERTFGKQELSTEQISQLLWACQGITENTWRFRTAPSSGATYPLEVYVCKKDGVYHYLPESHSLEQTKKVDVRPALVRASLGQAFVGEAPAVFVIAADFDRTREKYGNRAERYVPMEAGHAAQNLLLQAVALGLVGCPVGAFWDDALVRSLELPFQHEPLYMIPIGFAK